MKFKPALPFALGLLCGLYFITLNITRFPFTHFPGDLADARFCTYLMEHVYQYLNGSVAEYWNAPFLYPEKDVLSYSENLIGTAPLYAFLRAIGADRYMAFNIWFIVLSVLNYAAAYLFIRTVLKNSYAAACGAFIFAFSIALQSQVVHAQTFARFPIALIFYCGVNFFRTCSPRSFFLMVFWLVYQFWCSIYLGMLMVMPFCIFFIAIIVAKRTILLQKLKGKQWLLNIFTATVLNLILLYLLMSHYITRAGQVKLYSYDAIFETIPSIRSLLFCQPGSLFWKALEATGLKYQAYWDHWLFPGGIVWLAIILCLFLFVFKRKRLTSPDLDASLMRVLCITGVLTVLTFMRFKDYSLYAVVHALPGFGSLRAIQRIINIDLLFFGVAFAWLVKLLLEKVPKYNALIFAGILGLTVADNYMREEYISNTDISLSRERTAMLLQKMNGLKPGSLISYEPDTFRLADVIQVDAMIASQDLHLKCLNGYTSTAPYFYWRYWSRPNKPNRLLWIAAKGVKEEVIVIK
jgi:hypothetical protein